MCKEDVQSWLRELLRKGPSTNMALEGLLAEMKASCPRPTDSGCNAEKFAYLGAVVQLMQKHLAAGKPDPRTAGCPCIAPPSLSLCVLARSPMSTRLPACSLARPTCLPAR
eukprot:3544830-Lingulodinium_polyedra.AAC.1